MLQGVLMLATVLAVAPLAADAACPDASCPDSGGANWFAIGQLGSNGDCMMEWTLSFSDGQPCNDDGNACWLPGPPYAGPKRENDVPFPDDRARQLDTKQFCCEGDPCDADSDSTTCTFDVGLCFCVDDPTLNGEGDCAPRRREWCKNSANSAEYYFAIPKNTVRDRCSHDRTIPCVEGSSTCAPSGTCTAVRSQQKTWDLAALDAVADQLTAKYDPVTPPGDIRPRVLLTAPGGPPSMCRPHPLDMGPWDDEDPTTKCETGPDDPATGLSDPLFHELFPKYNYTQPPSPCTEQGQVVVHLKQRAFGLGKNTVKFRTHFNPFSVDEHNDALRLSCIPRGVGYRECPALP